MCKLQPVTIAMMVVVVLVKLYILESSITSELRCWVGSKDGGEGRKHWFEDRSHKRLMYRPGSEVWKCDDEWKETQGVNGTVENFGRSPRERGVPKVQVQMGGPT